MNSKKIRLSGLFGLALLCAFLVAPSTALAWRDTIGPSVTGGDATFSGTVGSTTDTASSTMPMPSVKDNTAGYGKDGRGFGGTYSYNLTCGTCHTFDGVVKSHRACAICHGDTTGAGFIDSMQAKDSADPSFWSTITKCEDCHDGTIAPVPHENSAQAVYNVHAMDAQSVAQSCGPKISLYSNNMACHVRNLLAEHRNVHMRYVYDSTLDKPQRVEVGRLDRALDCTDCHKKDASGKPDLSSSSGSFGYDLTKGQCVDCHPDSHMTKDSDNYNKMMAAHESEVPLQVWSEYATDGPRMQVGENAILAHGIEFQDNILKTPEAFNATSSMGCTGRGMCHNSAFEAAADLNIYDALRVEDNKFLTHEEIRSKAVTCGNPYGNPYCHYGATKPLSTATGEYIAMDNGSMNREGKPGYLGDGQWWDGGTFLEGYHAYLTLDLSGQTIASGSKLQFKNRYYFQNTVGATYSNAGTDASAPDYGRVQVRVDKTGDWTDLWVTTGSSYDWSYKTIDLSAYAGKQIEIRWASEGNGDFYNGWGWELQDISLRDSGDAVTYQAPMDVTTTPWTRLAYGQQTTTEYDPELDEDVTTVTQIDLPEDYGFYSAFAAAQQLITTDDTGKIIAVDVKAYDTTTHVLDLYTSGGEAATSIDPAVLKNTNFSGATTVILPPTLTDIPAGLFENMSSLTLVGTPETVALGVLPADFGLTNLNTIGARAFFGTSLKGALVISPNVSSIGPNAFRSTKLTSLRVAWMETTAQGQRSASARSSIMNISPTGTAIGDSAFEELSTLQTVEIGNGVNAIGAAAFKNTGITTLTFQQPLAANLTIGQAAFWVPTFNQFEATPTKLDIANGASTTMDFIFNNPSNSVPASSTTTIALIAVGALGAAFYALKKRNASGC